VTTGRGTFLSLMESLSPVLYLLLFTLVQYSTSERVIRDLDRVFQT